MLDWFAENLATIAVSAVLLALVGLIIWSVVKQKRQGRSSCGGGCQGCALHGKCHQK